MLQAVLLGAAVGSASAFVPAPRPALSGRTSAAGVSSATSAQMTNWAKAKAAVPRTLRSRAVEAHGLQMISAGIEKGMFTTSSPEDRRVMPETRDGKAYFKVSG